VPFACGRWVIIRLTAEGTRHCRSRLSKAKRVPANCAFVLLDRNPGFARCHKVFCIHFDESRLPLACKCAVVKPACPGFAILNDKTGPPHPDAPGQYGSCYAGNRYSATLKSVKLIRPRDPFLKSRNAPTLRSALFDRIRSFQTPASSLASPMGACIRLPDQTVKLFFSRILKFLTGPDRRKIAAF
jgi:hypothetical protein